MDPVLISSVVINVWKVLEPYVKKIGDKLAEKTGESLPNVVDRIWELVKGKMEAHAVTKELPSDLVTTPEDIAVQGAFQYQLRKLLESDEAFAKQIKSLIGEARRIPAYSAILDGHGAIAQGDNSVAVGRSGIYISGPVSESNINNQCSEE